LVLSRLWPRVGRRRPTALTLEQRIGVTYYQRVQPLFSKNNFTPHIILKLLSKYSDEIHISRKFFGNFSVIFRLYATGFPLAGMTASVCFFHRVESFGVDPPLAQGRLPPPNDARPGTKDRSHMLPPCPTKQFLMDAFAPRTGPIPMKPALRQRMHHLQYWLRLYKIVGK
jgi:hypothetical protein